MKVSAFIGPSGSGKSHRASWVAKERGIEYIIDDGLLIKDNQVIAGASAKRESTRIGSIRHALFAYDEQAEEIKRAFAQYKPASILILGTSEQMIDSITKRLRLPEISERIYINDVAEEYEIKEAMTTRKEQGKHVIPVPTFEIKKDFSGYFLDPLQIFRRKGKASYQLVGEKSVVRPTFSYLGNYTISDYTIYQIVEHVLTGIRGISKITRFRAESRPDGIYIDLDVILVYGSPIINVLRDAQRKTKEEVERLTALNIKALDISAKGLTIEPEA